MQVCKVVVQREELWFDAAYASEIGQQVAADSLAHVGGRIRSPGTG